MVAMCEQPSDRVCGELQRVCKESQQWKEPLIPTPLPDHVYPWQVVGTDLFELNGEKYLLLVNYYSQYPEIVKLSTTTSSAIIKMLKPMFARHGIPEVVRSDNGPQYAYEEFSQFAQMYGFIYQQSELPTKQWVG